MFEGNYASKQIFGFAKYFLPKTIQLKNIIFKIPNTGKSLSEALLFAEQVVYKNCSECEKQFLYTTCSPQV